MLLCSIVPLARGQSRPKEDNFNMNLWSRAVISLAPLVHLVHVVLAPQLAKPFILPPGNICLECLLTMLSVCCRVHANDDAYHMLACNSRITTIHNGWTGITEEVSFTHRNSTAPHQSPDNDQIRAFPTVGLLSQPDPP